MLGFSQSVPRVRLGASRFTSNPYCRWYCAQYRFMRCRQLNPRQPAGQVHWPLRALQVPTCSSSGREGGG